MGGREEENHSAEMIATKRTEVEGRSKRRKRFEYWKSWRFQVFIYEIVDYAIDRYWH